MKYFNIPIRSNKTGETLDIFMITYNIFIIGSEHNNHFECFEMLFHNKMVITMHTLFLPCQLVKPYP